MILNPLSTPSPRWSLAKILAGWEPMEEHSDSNDASAASDIGA